MKPTTTVRIILEDELERILLLKRAEGSYNGGAWCLPGGKVDYRDSLQETCRKEVYEETGLTIGTPEHLFIQQNIPKFDGEMHCLTHYFAADYAGSLRLNDESADARWVHPNDLPSYTLAFDNDVGIEKYLELKRADMNNCYHRYAESC